MLPCTSKNFAPKQIIFHLLLYPSFFSQINPVLTYWIVFATVYLHFYLLVFDNLRVLKFIQCLCAFFIKTSKVLMRFNVLFQDFQSQNVLLSKKHSYPSTVNIIPEANNSLLLVLVLHGMRSSLRRCAALARQN